MQNEERSLCIRIIYWY